MHYIQKLFFVECSLHRRKRVSRLPVHQKSISCELWRTTKIEMLNHKNKHASKHRKKNHPQFVIVILTNDNDMEFAKLICLYFVSTTNEEYHYRSWFSFWSKITTQQKGNNKKHSLLDNNWSRAIRLNCENSVHR